MNVCVDLCDRQKAFALRFYSLENITEATDRQLQIAHERAIEDGARLVEQAENYQEKPWDKGPTLADLNLSIAKRQYAADTIEQEAKRRGLDIWAYQG